MLTGDMKSIIKKANLGFVATKNADGTPNLSPKSTLRSWDSDHLIFANLASPQTIANLKKDSQIEINCIDFLSRRGYRFTGKASLHPPGSDVFDQFLGILKEELGTETKMHDAVLIKIISVRPVTSPAYDKDGVTEEKLVKSYKKKYGVGI